MAAPGDTIVLADETYAETIVVDQEVTLRGSATASSIIDGGSAGTVVTVLPGVSLTLETLTVRNGRTLGHGGGVLNQGMLIARSVLITSNVAAQVPSSRGGGIYSSGQLTLLDSTVSGNQSQSGGGGIYVAGVPGTPATALIEHTEISDNQVRDVTTDFRGGGGLHVTLGSATIRSSRIENNRTDFTGGGVTVRGSGTEVEITDTTIDGNTSRLGLGIAVQQSARLTVVGSTISNNQTVPGQSSTGGGLRADGRVTVVNSTIFGNTVTGSGGGILAESLVTLDSVTIAGNSAAFGGGIASFTGTTTVNNSIVAGNVGSTAGNDCNGTISGGVGLLIADPGPCTLSAVVGVIVADPMLGPLQNNGGSTLTLAPDVDSPAVDAGATSLTTDQRGLPRPAGAGPDLGAVELQQAVVDTIPPEWTAATLTATSVSSQGFSIEWSGASDDVGVTGYEVSIDGVVRETVPAPETTATISGLAAATAYDVEVQAVDAAGNRSADGPGARITTGPSLPSGHLLPPATDPSATWQGQLPIGQIDAARQLGQLVVVASAGANDSVVTFVTLATPTTIDIDVDGSDDALVTVDLAPGPGLIPEVVMTTERLALPGPEDVQIVALVPLDDNLATALGRTSLAVGFGSAAISGGSGGHLPQRETITASIDQIEGLFHRLHLRFDTVDELNPLVFYVGAAEGDGRDLGATAASLLAIQSSPVPSEVELSLGIEVSALTSAEPALNAVLEWGAPTGETDPDVVFFYLESERVPKGSAADYDTRVVVEDIDPDTSLTLSLVPDEALEVRLWHNDPSNDPPNAIGVDRIDRVQLEHTRNGLDIRAAIRDLPGPELVLRLEDGTGDLVVSNSSFPFDLEFEVSRPGSGFFGNAFSNPVDWIFASALDVKEMTVHSADGGGTDVSFAGVPPDLIFVAADDPDNLRFPAEQERLWPATHPSQWPAAGGLHVGLVDDSGGTTLAVVANNTPSFRVALNAPSLGQTIELTALENARLDVDVELGPGANAEVPTRLGCEAALQAGTVSFDLQPPGSLSFRSGGGTELACYGATGTKSLLAGADTFPALAEVEFVVDKRSAEVRITAEDENEADDPLGNAYFELTDVSDGLTGIEPLGDPAQLLALGAEELPSTLVNWAHEPGGDLELEIQSTAVEDRLEHLRFLLATNRAMFTEPFKPSVWPSVPLLRRTGAAPAFLPANELAFHLWELPQLTLMAATVDEARRLWASTAVDGTSELEIHITQDRQLVTELFLPARGHFLRDVSVAGWCDLAVPGGTSGLDAKLPDSVYLVTDSPEVFASLQCRHRVQVIGEPGLDLDALVDAHGIPDGTTVSTDLPGGSMSIAGSALALGDLTIEVRDRSDDGLPVGSPFAHPIRTLGMRADGAHSLGATWKFEEGEMHLDLTAAKATDAIQFRVSTRADAAALEEPGDGHSFMLRDEGADPGHAVAQFTISDFRNARLDYDESQPLPLNVHVGSASTHPLTFDVFIDFDSPLAPKMPPGIPLQITAAGTLQDVSESATYSTNLQHRHQVEGAGGGDLRAHIIVDNDRTDEDEDEDPALEIFIAADDLPAWLGLDAYGFAPDDALVQGALLEMTGLLPMLDLVLRDPRPEGVLASGSQRVRIHAEQVPRSLTFVQFGQLDGDGGLLAIRGVASGRVGRVLMESDDFIDDPRLHFGSPFSRITADLTDVPPTFDLLVELNEADGTKVVEPSLVELSFTDGAVPAAGPDLNDRIGRAEVILELERPSPFVERGRPLTTYAVDAFTRLDRSTFVRAVDDRYWPAGVSDRLVQAESGFSLATGLAPVPLAADGDGAALRTSALDDYVIVRPGEGREDDWELIALQVSNVHSLSLNRGAPNLMLQVTRPDGTVSPPLYLAIEGYVWPRYEPAPDKPKPSKPDKDAPQVEDDVKHVRYESGPVLPFEIGVLENDDKLADASTLKVAHQPDFGIALISDGKLTYIPGNPFRVGRDRIIYEVCTTTGACAQARVDIVIYEVYLGGTYARLDSLPNQISVFTEGHLERTCPLILSSEDLSRCLDVPIVDRIGYIASGSPTGADIYIGPRTLPPVSVPPALRLHIIEAPQSLTYFVTHPDRHLFRYKADATGDIDIAGVNSTAKGRIWFGARGNGGFEVAGAANGLISQILTGERPAEEFRGCDRIFGLVDTCVALIGISVAGDAGGTVLDGFFSYAPRTETTLVARSKGAADFEYLPLITLLTGELRSIQGSAQLQFEPFKVPPPFEVDVDLKVKASDLKVDLWARGSEGAAAGIVWKGLGTISVALVASYDINLPFPVIPAPMFDPYE